MRNHSLLFWVVAFTCPVICLKAEVVKILIQGDTQYILNSNNGKQDNFIPLMAKVLTDPHTKDADFILQMGDIVDSDEDNSDRPQQYQVAQQGWRQLDGKIPYVLNVGNNDAAAEFLEAFPLSHYNTWPSFVDNYNDHINVAHQFSAGGVDWLVISLRYQSDTNELAWVEALIENNPEKQVILIKHEVNSDNNPIVNMLKRYANVVFIFSGHTRSQQKLLTGDNGNQMGWIRTNHHNENLDSYFRILLIDTVAGTVSSRFYSPQYEKFWHDPNAPYHDCEKSKPWTYTDFDFGVEGASPAVSGNDAKLISMEVPCCLLPGQAFEAQIRYRNTGTNQWAANSQYKLSSQNPKDNLHWGSGTNQEPTSVAVEPGENHTFTIECIAPSSPGNYNFQYRMLQETVQRFGEYSENRIVHVASNQVVDGSFEDPYAELNAWKLGDGVTISEDQQRSGRAALKLTHTSRPTFQRINLEPNTFYKVSVYVRNDEVISGNVVFDTSDIFDEEIGIPEFRVEPGEANEWTELSGVFNSALHASVRLRIFTSALDGVAYVDDVQLTPVLFPTQVAYENTPYIYVGSATNADGHSLEYSAVNIPGWMEFNAAERKLMGIPEARDVGTHAVTLRVTNGIESDIETFTLAVFSSSHPFAEWKGIHGISSDIEDADNDGLVNLLEFALGGNPRENDQFNVVPKFSFSQSSADFSFRRHQLTANYVIQKSTNLIEWSDHITVGNSDGWVGDALTISMPTSGDNVFFKLKVSQ
jgi:hypothetical protein